MPLHVVVVAAGVERRLHLALVDGGVQAAHVRIGRLAAPARLHGRRTIQALRLCTEAW